MAYEIIRWIFDDALKQDNSYKGILVKPYTKAQDVSEQLQKLREKGLSKGDKRIDSFLHKVDVFEKKDIYPYKVSEAIDDNNSDWEDKIYDQLDKATSMDDIKQIEDDVKAEKGIYEDDTVKRVEDEISGHKKLFIPPSSGIERNMEVESIISTIRGAKNQDEMPELLSSKEMDKAYGKQEANRIREERDEQLHNLESLDEKVRNQISIQIAQAQSVDDLDRIDVSRAKTYGTEAELRDMIERRKKQLE